MQSTTDERKNRLGGEGHPASEPNSTSPDRSASDLINGNQPGAPLPAPRDSSPAAVPSPDSPAGPAQVSAPEVVISIYSAHHHGGSL